MTQKEMYAHIAEVMADDAEVVEFCNKKLEQLNKPRKPRTNPEAEEFAESVYQVVIDADNPVTNKDVATALEVKAQKAAAGLKRLVKAGRVVRNDENKPATFTVA